MKSPPTPRAAKTSAPAALGDVALRALRVSESRYRRLFEAARDGILLLNADTGQIEDVNPYLIEMLGYSHAEFLGRKLWEVGAFADRAESKEMFAELQATGYVRYEDLPLKTKAGARLEVEFVSNTYDCEGIKVTQCNIRDITERKAAENKAQRHTQLYAALSQCNKAIVHCDSEEEMFLQVCRAAVQFGGMKMAWVGLVDAETLMVRPAASFGDDTGYLKDLNISVDADSRFGRGPTAIAMRENQPSWCQDVRNNPATVLWHERAAHAGFAASASLPLRRNSVVVGAFSLYSGEAGSFDESARELLVEMATDISFALDNFARESQRERVEQEIKFKNTILQTQQETSLDAILVVGESGQIISYNRQFIDLWRLPPQLVSARVDAPVLQCVADQVENAEAYVARVQYLNEHRDDKSREEVSLRDGRIIDRYSAPVTGADRQYYGRVWYFRDITERKMAEQKFKDLLEAAPDAMVIVNRDAEMVLVNAQAVNVFGWQREELLGQKVDILVPERFRSRHPENRSAFFAQPRARLMGAGLDLFGLRKDGSEFPVEVSLSPLETSEGTLAITTIRDVTERKLADAQRNRLALLVEASPDFIGFADPKTRHILYINKYGRALCGIGEDENVKELSITDVHPAWMNKLLAEVVLPTAERDGVWMGDGALLHRDGHEIPISMALLARKTDSGEVDIFYTISRDITERKTAERRIAYLNRVYAVLSDINTLIVRVRERDELFKEACRIAVEKGGFHMALIAIVDRSTMTIAPVASAGVDERFLILLKDRFSLIEGAPQGNAVMTRAIREKKTVVINDLQSNPDVVFRQQYAETGIRSVAVFPLIVSDEAAGVLVLYADESEFFHDEEMKLLTELAGDIAFAIDHIEKQARLDYLAYYDALTGLANRSLFLDRVTQYMRSAASGGHKLAVFLTDLERFKNINDSLGREAGDALLRQVAEWLTLKVGDANLLARVGADQFAFVMPEVKQEGNLARFLEKWMDVFLEHPYRLNDAVFRISLKVGIAVFPDDGADAETLFGNAEAALKKAKASGDRYLFYTQKMTEAMAGKLTLENQLRQALDQEESVLHYQPKVNLASGKLTGVEALIRWNDPRTGLLPPGRFIPILEEIGLIYEVGRWALRQAIKDYLRWRAAGLPAVRIAVNVSPLQLRHRGFIEEIRQVIGVDPSAPAGLELEITESLIMEDVKGTIASLQAIRAMGVCIAIDDFGTGFSSLSYLAKLPVDTLKIDRSFVTDMTAAQEGLALVSTIINLAHSLNLKVVAEGVETEEQSRLLRLLACDEMQGFLFSKPVPGEIFETRFLAPPAAA